MWPMILLGAIQGGSSIYQGITQSKATRAEADRIRQEADIKREEARLTRDSLYDQARKTQTQGSAFIGSQKSSFASAGVKTDEGSPLAIMRESQKSIQQDVSRIRSTGNRALKLGLNQADIMDQSADFADKYAGQQLGGSIIGGVTSFLGGVVQNSIYENFWAEGVSPKTNNWTESMRFY